MILCQIQLWPNTLSGKIFPDLFSFEEKAAIVQKHEEYSHFNLLNVAKMSNMHSYYAHLSD